MNEFDLPDIEPNSHEYHKKKADGSEEKKEKKLKPVVDQSKMAKPESELKKKARGLKTTFVREILIPGLKDAFMDFLGLAFYNDRRRGSYNRTGGYYNYGGSYRSSYGSTNYRNDRSYDRRDNYGPKNKKVDYRNVVLVNRRDAEEIVENLRGRIAATGQASLGDLFDLIDVTSDFTDDNWGWTDARDIGIRKVSNGWLVDVSEVEPL